jgi:hypothetical protein
MTPKQYLYEKACGLEAQALAYDCGAEMAEGDK